MSPAAAIVCMGEILWDVLPSGQQPGGAPFNAAVHLHQLGLPVRLISRVGDDELGRELLACCTRPLLTEQDIVGLIASAPEDTLTAFPDALPPW